MTFPSNIKPREVWCPVCKKIEVSDKPNPKCHGDNGIPMITVLYSSDGTRLTGQDELGATSCRLTQ